MLPEIQSQNKSTTYTLNNFKVKNGQNIDNLVKNMTAEEKATVKLFDINSNGVFDGKESDVFNTSVFDLSEGNINICLKDYENTKVATIEQRNYFKLGDEVEFFGPNLETFTYKVEEIIDEDGNNIDIVRHPKQVAKMRVDTKLNPNDMMRIKNVLTK